MSSSRRLAVALGLAMAACSGVASANGRFPLAQHVVVGPGADSKTVVLRTTFGFVLSDDGGKSFRFVCEEALGYGGVAYDPPVAIDSTGRVIAGLFDGASSIGVDRCSFPRLAPLEKEFVADLDNDTYGNVIVAVTATGFTERRNGVWRSDDAGKTWKALGAGLLAVQLDTVELAPTNGKRVYAAGVELIPARRAVAYRSDDGGATLTELKFPVADAVAVYVSGIDPTNADVLYLRALVDDAGKRRTALLRSEDGGTSFKQVAISTGQMLGFAVGDDGKTVWWGGPDEADGLFRSVDSGKTFARIGSTHVMCLRNHMGALWVCGMELVDGFSLARSADKGSTLTPMLRLREIVGPFACSPGSIESTTCADRLAAVRPLFPEVDAGPVDSGPVPDGGAPDAPFDAGGTDSTVPSPDGSTSAPPEGGVAQNVLCTASPAAPATRDPDAWSLPALALAAAAWGVARRAPRRARARGSLSRE